MVEAARPSPRAIPRRLRPSTLSAASRSLSSNLRCVPPDIAPSRIAVLGQSVTTTPQDVALHAGVRHLHTISERSSIMLTLKLYYEGWVALPAGLCQQLGLK